MDGAVIPGCVGINPFLTISAVSERAVHHLAEDYGWKIKEYVFHYAGQYRKNKRTCTQNATKRASHATILQLPPIWRHSGLRADALSLLCCAILFVLIFLLIGGMKHPIQFQEKQ